MIEAYFAQIEKALQEFPSISSYTLNKKVYSNKQGYISGSIIFENGHRLDFAEVKNSEIANKIKYRYHYMDEKEAMIFRYDDAPHHSEVPTSPHHKHTPNGVRESSELTLYEVLLEIAQLELEDKPINCGDVGKGTERKET